MAPRGMADGVAAGAVGAPPVPAGGAPGWQALTTRTTTNAGMNRAPRTARSGFQVQEGRHSGVQHLAMLGVSRLFVLFDQKVEYFFNCQSTPETRAELDGACDQALHTIQRTA